MSLQSDIVIEAGKFDPANNLELTNKFNETLIARLATGVPWYEIGAAKYRERAWSGENVLPPPVILPEGINFTIPSRHAGREIPCRIMYPSGRKTEDQRTKCRATMMHIHGGGWTLADEKSYDSLLQFNADAGDMAVISIGYRLAPEDPFPRGPEDCFDAGEYLAKSSEKLYGAPLKFIGGESAGGHLSMLTAIHLLKVRPSLRLSGLLLHFGCYDLSVLPYCRKLTDAAIIPKPVMDHFIDAFIPGMLIEERRSPAISPLYEDLSQFRGHLPSALFTCGTEDPLLDDSVFMGTKWMMAGGEAVIKIYTGAVHGFIMFPPESSKEVSEVLSDTTAYIQHRLNTA